MRCDWCKHWGGPDGPEDGVMGVCGGISEKFEIESEAFMQDYATWQKNITQICVSEKAYTTGDENSSSLWTTADFFCAKYQTKNASVDA